MKVGYVRATSEQFGAPTNLNISNKIIDFGIDSLFPYLDKKLMMKASHFLIIIRWNYPNDTVRSSTTAINDGNKVSLS